MDGSQFACLRSAVEKADFILKNLEQEHNITQMMKPEQLALGGEQYVLGLVCQVYRSIGIPLDMLLKYYSACEGL